MKRFLFALTLTVFALSMLGVRLAAAQTDTPPTETPAAEVPPSGPVGQVIGRVVNRNTGKVVAQSLNVMLHVLDEDLTARDMLHAQSRPDGTFTFADVPFEVASKFAVMATYEGASYTSAAAPADMSTMEVSIEVPVYDSTSDLKEVQVDQMHVLFDLAPDGLETKEIYVFSSQSDRTVKDAYKLDDAKSATLEFPLPKDADYIFFQPDDQDRFVKLNGGFADTYPLLPGAEPSQIMVSYLVPYSSQRTYSYTAPLNVARINFLLPDAADLSLGGQGLAGPEPMTLQNGTSYRVYSFTGLAAGQTVNITIQGSGAGAAAGSLRANTPTAIGAAILGLLVIGTGIFWWRRSGSNEEQEQLDSDTAFDQLVGEIARLDQSHEMGDIDDEEYRRSRGTLMRQAKALFEQAENEE
ncbi:MAG: hypothetical protein ACM3QS_02915 [Bacteroidota bacterium]